MRKSNFIMDFRESHRLFKLEVRIAEDEPYPEYYRFLTGMGFSDFIAYIVTAAVSFPYSIEACHDELSNLAYPMCETSNRRLSHVDQNRLARLVERCGNEVIKTLDATDYYHNRSNKSPDEYDAIIAKPEVRRISTFTFEVRIREEDQEREQDMHELLSNSNFETITPRQWIH